MPRFRGRGRDSVQIIPQSVGGRGSSRDPRVLQASWGGVKKAEPLVVKTRGVCKVLIQRMNFLG